MRPDFLHGARRPAIGGGGGDAGVPWRVGRRVAADWQDAPLAPAVPLNGRFRWAAGGCWGLQMGIGVEKTPLETTGA
jgi:hypothetical protein